MIRFTDATLAPAAKFSYYACTMAKGSATGIGVAIIENKLSFDTSQIRTIRKQCEEDCLRLENFNKRFHSGQTRGIGFNDE